MNKKICALLAVIVVCSMAFTGCGSEKSAAKDLKVYSFSGGNDYFTVSNGVIVLSDNCDALYLGSLKTDSEHFSGITSYSTELYMYRDGEKQLLSSNSVTDTTGGKLIMDGELGKMLGEGGLFSQRLTEDVENNLFFELETTDKEGNVQNYQLQMKVVEVTEDTKA